MYVATSHCLIHEQYLLLNMKHNLVFNPVKSEKLVHWNQSGDCCQWNGVTCSELGRVIGLDLSEEFITEGLDNSSLTFHLRYLKFGLLKNLRYLNLSNAGFEGQIPIEIALLTKQATLDLSTSFNLLHSLKLEKPNIGMLMQNLTEITELYLDGVMASATGKECPILESLANLSNLTTLQLSNCALTDVFPKGIFQMQKLKILDVSYNQDPHGSLPNFTQEGYLQTLSLSNTNISGQLPSTISDLKHLAIVDLYGCQFNGTLPVSLSKLSQLFHMDLSFNNFSGPLPSLNMSNNLKYLSLFQNALTGPITSTQWEKLLNLISINFGDNSFSGKFPSTLFTLPSLQELILSHNGFDGPIPKSFLHLKNLGYLLLSPNQFNGTIWLDMFHRMQYLQTLGLSHNNLTVDITSSGDHGLSAFPNMTNLLLADCNLRKFPSFLIPSLHICLVPLKQKLSWKNPESFCNCSTLRMLDLSHNSFNGSIPECLTSRSNTLRVLDLVGNKLTDSFSYTVSSSCHLRLFNLHGNLFEGYHSKIFVIVVNKGLQMKLVKIPNVFTSLDFSSKHFEGSLPEELMSLRALIVLNLPHNAFSSYIPSSLGNLTQIESLYLPKNILSGGIPTGIATFSFLSVLNLSYNHLVGKIPRDTQIQSFEEDSFKRNEGLFGPPLTKSCTDGGVKGSPTPPSSTYKTKSSIYWNVLSGELGFIFDLGLVILPFIFCKRWRLWYCKHMEDLLCWIFPQLYFVMNIRERK
ncbi:Receptor-like protein Cf-9-like, partial [Glycine soja]